MGIIIGLLVAVGSVEMFGMFLVLVLWMWMWMWMWMLFW